MSHSLHRQRNSLGHTPLILSVNLRYRVHNGLGQQYHSLFPHVHHHHRHHLLLLLLHCHQHNLLVVLALLPIILPLPLPTTPHVFLLLFPLLLLLLLPRVLPLLLPLPLLYLLRLVHHRHRRHHSRLRDKRNADLSESEQKVHRRNTFPRTIAQHLPPQLQVVQGEFVSKDSLPCDRIILMRVKATRGGR
jgi:hypothetical protein